MSLAGGASNFGCNVHKIAFHLGPLPIHWFGILVMAGLLVGLWTASRRSVRAGIDPARVWDVGTWMIIGTILGARALYVISYWREEFAGRPWTEILMVQHGGLVFYGGFVGAALAVILYTRSKKMPLWRFADVLAPSIPLGYVLGRMGCLLNGCCYGRATTLPWAIRYPEEHDSHGVPVHPTQVYDALVSLGLYAALAWLFRRRKFDGQVFAAYMVLYPLLRGGVEFLRGDYPQRYLGGWATPAHLWLLLVVPAGALLYWYQSRTKTPSRTAA